MGQCVKVVGAVDLQPVGGVSDKGLALMSLLRRDAGGDQVAVDRPRQERPHRRGCEHRDRESDHVAEVGRLGEGARESPRPVRAGQALSHKSTQVLRVRPGDRGVGGDPVGGLGPAQVLPHGRRAPVVTHHVHRRVRARLSDHGGEVVGQSGQGVGGHRPGHRRGAGTPVVITDHPVGVGESLGHRVPDPVRVGPAVHQHHRRPGSVALFVDREADAVGDVEVANSPHCWSDPVSSSSARSLLRRSILRRASWSRIRLG